MFQFHPDAYERLRDAWLHEDLRSLAWDDPLNSPYVVVLEGLSTFESARLLADRCLNHEAFVASRPDGGISPFTEASLQKVWEVTKPRPRWFLRVLHDLLQLGNSERVEVLDEAFVEPKLERLSGLARTAEPTQISLHVAAFENHLQNRDITGKQVQETTSRLSRIITDCGFTTIAEVNSHDVEVFLGQLRADGKSKQTSNHYLKAIKQFCRWLVRTKRSDQNPVADIRRLNVQTDRRHDRRAISGEEFAFLVAAAEAGPVIESIPGPDRAVMYILSAWTGYRKGEIGSLTIQSFDLESDPPTVTVQAAFSKRKRRDTQVLHPDVVQRFLEWLQTKSDIPLTALLFPVSGKVPGGTERKTHKMMQRDLESARKAWLDDAEDEKECSERDKPDFLRYKDSQDRFADFHANRHTFITNLGRAGVSPKTTQELARHSDIRLTLNVYTHADLADKVEAVGRLPAPPANGRTKRKGLPQAEAEAEGEEPRECSGSAPESQTDANGHSTSQMGNGKPPDSRPSASPQSLAVEPLDATCRLSSADVASIPDRIRTVLEETFGSGGRRQDSVSGKPAKELGQEPKAEVPTVVPTLPEPVFGADLPPDLAEVVTAWLNLPRPLQTAILSIVRSETDHRD